MVSNNLVNPALHAQPAVMVGGQRRRVIRRASVPRSNTVPAFGPSSTPPVNSLVGGTATGSAIDPGISTTASLLSGPVNSMNPTWTPTSSYTDKIRPSSISHSSDGSPNMLVAQSPTLTVASTSTSSKESRKKHGMFSGLLSKGPSRPNSSHESSPKPELPPQTPVKAVQFLGEKAGIDGSYDRPVGKTLHRQTSSPLLTMFKDIATGQSKHEQGIDPDPQKSKGSRGNRNKALRLLDIVSRGSSSKIETEENAAAGHLGKDAKQHFSSEPVVHALSPSSHGNARPAAEAPNRRSRKKVSKPVDRMTPITETSHDGLRDSYDSGFELDLISEYAKDSPRTSPLDSVLTKTLSSTSANYELGDDDLSSTDGTTKEETEFEDLLMHPGHKVDVDTEECQDPHRLHLRGPLQTIEDRLLDATEAQLKATNAQLNAYKNLLDMNDWQRRITDAAVAKVKAEHEAFKEEFAKTTREWSLEQQEKPDKKGSGDDNDLPSIRSSIDLDEEPTVHIATAMPIMVVKPGMVKLIDIPPRKKKPVVPVDSAAPDDAVVSNAKVAPAAVKGPVTSKHVQSPSNETKLPLQPVYHFQPEAIVSSFEELECRESIAMPGPPLPAKGFSRLDREKQPDVIREESQMHLQDWVSAYEPATHRPLPAHVNANELVDQAIPPPPLPKDDGAMSPAPPPKDHTTSPHPARSSSKYHATSPHPVRSSSKEHHCITNGHIFCSTNLKTVPDETYFNSLEVRPYLRTPSGIKQHVHVPVLCERCNEDVRGELWKCSIPTCSMGVCKDCAEDMKREWVERVTTSTAKDSV
ncbi:hypothetical protein P3342_012799 [Pyrenophora teres f. teres]|nr:hypothetical protein P3342_012799 [Pyrenophora teres f. teres]